jgi:hypothetical protein
MVRSPQKIAQLLEFRIRPSCNETWSPGTTLPNNLTLMPCLYGGVLSEMNAFLTLLIPRAPCAFNLEVTSRLQLPNVLVVEKAGSRASAIVGVGAACRTVSDSSASGLASGQIGLQAPREVAQIVLSQDTALSTAQTRAQPRAQGKLLWPLHRSRQKDQAQRRGRRSQPW